MIDKQKLLEEAVEKNQILIFEHDAYTECCTVTKNSIKYSIGETMKLAEIL